MKGKLCEAKAALGGLSVYYISYTFFLAASQPEDQAGSVGLILDFLIAYTADGWRRIIHEDFLVRSFSEDLSGFAAKVSLE